MLKKIIRITFVLNFCFSSLFCKDKKKHKQPGALQNFWDRRVRFATKLDCNYLANKLASLSFIRNASGESSLQDASNIKQRVHNDLRVINKNALPPTFFDELSKLNIDFIKNNVKTIDDSKEDSEENGFAIKRSAWFFKPHILMQIILCKHVFKDKIVKRKNKKRITRKRKIRSLKFMSEFDLGFIKGFSFGKNLLFGLNIMENRFFLGIGCFYIKNLFLGLEEKKIKDEKGQFTSYYYMYGGMFEPSQGNFYALKIFLRWVLGDLIEQINKRLGIEICLSILFKKTSTFERNPNFLVTISPGVY